ncbi:MAG TPA: DUF3617 domain-containing protein [Methylotenera sp.]|nr:DUF3617 domain-containing protein [Methylotenera sp.]
MNKLFIASLLLLPITSTAGGTENPMRAGLWEITTTSNLLNFASQIPPDQMDNLNALAKEYGFEMPSIQNGAAKTSTCITPEMASHKVVPDSFQTPAGCNVKSVTRNGSSYHAEYVCDNPQIKGNGIADGTFTSMESFTGRTVFNGTVQGTPINETADISGKWLDASCGDTKPVQQ